jgi:hypothetical protein
MISTFEKRAGRTLAIAGGLLAAALPFAAAASAMEQTSTTSGSAIGMSGSSTAMAQMGSSTASHAGGTHATTMGSMSMTAGGHATNILPSWLAVLWMLVFFVIIAVHVRHVLESAGQRRTWHSGHVLMALGMAFMFAPASVEHFNIPAGFWSLAFANAALAVVLWMLYQAFAGQGTNALWLAMALDLGAMAYMWSPGGFQAPLTWLLVVYFAVQALLWATDRMRGLDEHTIFGGAVSVTPEGALSATVAEPLICFKDLRVSMAAMTIGMAYMFAAMQLVMA